MLTPREILTRLLPCSWRYNKIKPELGDKIHFGFIAQDLLRAFGDKYGFVDTTNDYLKVNYTEFIAPMVSIIMEQDARIQQLEQKLEKLYDIRASDSAGPRVVLGSDKRNQEHTG